MLCVRGVSVRALVRQCLCGVGVVLLQLGGHPDDGARVHQAADLAVDGARLAVHHEHGLVCWAHHVVAEHAGRHDRTVRAVPLRQVRLHRSPNASDHLHFAWKFNLQF